MIAKAVLALEDMRKDRSALERGDEPRRQVVPQTGERRIRGDAERGERPGHLDGRLRSRVGPQLPQPGRRGFAIAVAGGAACPERERDVAEVADFADVPGQALAEPTRGDATELGRRGGLRLRGEADRGDRGVAPTHSLLDEPGRRGPDAEREEAVLPGVHQGQAAQGELSQLLRGGSGRRS